NRLELRGAFDDLLRRLVGSTKRRLHDGRERDWLRRRRENSPTDESRYGTDRHDRTGQSLLEHDPYPEAPERHMRSADGSSQHSSTHEQETAQPLVEQSVYISLTAVAVGRFRKTV